MKKVLLAVSLCIPSVAALPAALACDGKDHAKPGATAKTTRLVPNLVAGKPFGFKVYAIQPGSAYQRAQFQPGDTLLAVDGKPVAKPTPDPLEAAVKTAPKGTRITISIQRAGKPTTLKLAI